MLFCHPSFRARERYHHSNPLRVNCRHISADHRHVETSLCFNIMFLFRISSHAHDPVWFRHKTTWSGQEKIMFGLQIFVFRSPQTRLETSRNTTSRQQSFLSSQAFHLCFICFWRLLQFPFSSFSVLLVPPAHSTFTSPPPQISLYLNSIFSSVSVASSVLFPLSWCCFRLFFSWSTSSLLHVCPPRLLSSWQMEIVPTVHQNIIQFRQHNHSWMCLDFLSKTSAFVATSSAGNCPQVLLKNTWICHNKHSWRRPNFLSQKYISMSPTSWLEMCWFSVKNIRFFCHWWS